MRGQPMLKAYRYLPAAVLATGVLFTASACASQTYGYRNGSYRQYDRRAYDNGYREGLEHGRDDARRGRDFAYTRHDEYRDADDGYHRGDGDKDAYRQAYRQGFQAGYTEAFRQVAAVGPSQRGGVFSRQPYPYPNQGGVRPGIYQSPAAQIGYRDGLEVGRDDARNRESYDPVRSKRYRSADHDYDRAYGSKDQYKDEYRQAFERGYADGYGQRRR